MSGLGERLRAAREGKGLNLPQAALETHIRISILQALEDGDYSHVPPSPFTRGLVHNYATFLGIDPELALEDYASEIGLTHEPAKPAHGEHLPVAIPNVPRFESRMLPGTLPAFGLVSRADLAPQSSLRADASFQTQRQTITPVFAQQLKPVFQVVAEPQAVPPPVQARSVVRQIASSRLPEITAIVILGMIFASIAIFFSGQFLSSLQLPHFSLGAAKATATATPFVQEDPSPTVMPTFEGSALGAPLIPSPTALPRAAAPPATLPAVPTGLSMTLEIQAASKMWAWVFVDNVEVFKGEIGPNQVRRWSAHGRIDVQVKDLPNGSVTLDDKAILARVFAERTQLERAWTLEPNGTARSVEPRSFN